jgi:ERCC4-type nuclease
MKIIIDEREINLFEKCKELAHMRLSSSSDHALLTIEKTVLHIGDIYITTDEDRHVAVIERKTLADLLASVKDGRYEEQSHRLIHSTGIHPHNVIYVIEGNINSLKWEQKRVVYSAMTSLNHFKGMSIVRTMTLEETAEWTVFFSEKVERNFCKKTPPKYLSSIYGHPNEEKTVVSATVSNPFAGSNTPAIKEYSTVVKKSKKGNLTPENIGVIFLSQIPYVNSVSAQTIMKKYDNSFIAFMKEMEINPDGLNDIYIENDGKRRKLGSNVIANVRRFLRKEETETETETETTAIVPITKKRKEKKSSGNTKTTTMVVETTEDYTIKKKKEKKSVGKNALTVLLSTIIPTPDGL